jgi:hypothetical protein
MTLPDSLKLAAIDEEDLAVISAHVQDAIVKVGDMAYLPRDRRFAIAMDRFTWEKAADGSRQDYERKRAVLTFDRVLAARTSGIDRKRPDTVLELLAVAFQPTEAPAGLVTFYFAGGAAIELTVEVIEVRLADLGKAWVVAAKPSHDLDGKTKFA